MSLALIYVRQSDHKRYERTTSPEVQLEECMALPAVKACEQVEVFRDLGKSGGKLNGRREFLRMVERIKAVPVEVVAAYDQSRAFRNNQGFKSNATVRRRLPSGTWPGQHRCIHVRRLITRGKPS